MPANHGWRREGYQKSVRAKPPGRSAGQYRWLRTDCSFRIGAAGKRSEAGRRESSSVQFCRGKSRNRSCPETMSGRNPLLCWWAADQRKIPPASFEQQAERRVVRFEVGSNICPAGCGGKTQMITQLTKYANAFRSKAIEQQYRGWLEMSSHIEDLYSKIGKVPKQFLDGPASSANVEPP